MCGLFGCLDRTLPDDLAGRLAAVTGSLRHRGPDADGTWTDPGQGVVLAHTRLSVIDVTAAGNQPMQSADGRLLLIYNGEIYNYRALRDELLASDPGLVFRGNTDTEVLLEACAAWGVETAVKKLVGMFAFALWDRQERVLHLVRDRLGIKPLYWGRLDGQFLFASELKAMLAYSGTRPAINRAAVAAFLRFKNIPAPATIYTGLHKLMPGAMLTLRAGDEPVITRYWTMDAVVGQGLQRRRSGESVTPAALTQLLQEAVRDRMLADVPLGALLSGGIDSSTVVALMQASADRPVRTFSIGFETPGYDEAGYAAAVAGHLGTEHTEYTVTADDALAVIPELSGIYDEPFADSSQIPTLLLSRLTRQQVTVALSGDGGDEVFSGYNRYLAAQSLLFQLGRRFPPGRAVLRQLVRVLSPRSWDTLFGLLPGRLRLPQAGDKLYRLIRVLGARDAELYRQLVSDWDGPGEPLCDTGDSELIQPSATVPAGLDNLAEQMQYLDSTGYLPDDVLTKVDRASMAASLEVRVPLLDHRVVEAAWSLPLPERISSGRGKWPLRRVLQQHLPEHLFDRPKTGFAVPLDAWLRGPLRDWAESLLDAKVLGEQGILAAGPVRQAWQQHLDGGRNRHADLWNVLMFQAWHAHWQT